ncbi:Ig-like domain-containing protein [Chitinophaga agri]|uniref:Tandem-95 repeat protein n=1 Tax=Chitinophaga agri TaxID=2703787 RepID=A0A6B9ZMC6_9BACT|nr:Ig-like domain-containing protein [Chitinophaga agri]QHS63610.1 tandem-95 repeat protein [Chitinophaga agri]
MKTRIVNVLSSLVLVLCSLVTFGQMPSSPCNPSGGKKGDILGIETKYRAPGGTAPVFTIPAGTRSITVYISSETGLNTIADNPQGDEDFITINAIIDLSANTSSGYVNYAKNTFVDGSGTNLYGWQKAPLNAFIPNASKIGDATPNLNNVNFTVAGNTLTITEAVTDIHSSYYVEYVSPYNNSINPMDPQVRALLHGTGVANTDLVVPIPAGASIISISGKGTNSSAADLNTSAGTEEGYSNLRVTVDLDAGLTDGMITLANGGADDRRSTYVINNLSSASTANFLSAAGIAGDYASKRTSNGAVGVYNPQIYVSGTNLIIRRDASYARDFDDAYVIEFYHRVGQGMSAEFINSDIQPIPKGVSSMTGVSRTFNIPPGTNAIYFNETGNACNTDREANENSIAAYAYIDLTTETAAGYFYQQVGLDGANRRDDNYAFKGVPLNNTSTRSHAGTVGFKGPNNYDIVFSLSADKTQLTVTNMTGLANPDYQFLLSMDYYGARPDVAFDASSVALTKGPSCKVVTATFNVCNPGAGNSSGGMPVSFYHGDPTTDPAAVLLYTGAFPEDLLEGECKVFSFDINMNSFIDLNIDMTIVLNDNGSFVPGGVGTAVGTPFTLSSLATQSTVYKECNYDNNLITRTLNVNNCPVPNLDPDLSSGAAGNYNYLNYFNAGSATGAKINDADLSILDPGGTTLARATVTLTNILDGAAEAIFVNGTLPAGITATGSGTGTIILNGVASQADYVTALGMIEYRNSNPSPNTTNRTITTVLYDGLETGPASTTTIVILTDPRINVVGNATAIADNSTTVNTLDGTDFGITISTTVQHTFTIGNVGTGVINLTATPAISFVSGDPGFTIVTQPGSTSLLVGQTTNFVIRFDPAAHPVGVYTAVVRIVNNETDTDRADYTFTVSATVNGLPVITDNTVNGNEDNTLTFTAADFTSHYSDPDGAPLNSIRITSLPLNGSFRLNGVVISVGQDIPVAQLGNITFVPTANWNGTTGFDWRAYDGTSYSTATARVTINIQPVNDGPQIVTPTSIAVTEDISASLKDISFSDIDAGTGSVTVTFSVPNGTLNAVSGAGVVVSGTPAALILTGSIPDINAFLLANNVTYSSTQNPPTTVLLTVNISDNGNTGSGGALQATATVPLGITAVNDAPVAVDDSITVTEDIPFTGNVLTNDTDVEGNTLTASMVTLPVNGTVVLNTNGSFTYTPNANFNGLDSLVYSICDNGTPSLCDTAVVRIMVTPVNDAPIAVTDSITLNEDVPFNGNVLTNDSDPEGDALTASLVTAPVNGTVALNPDGSFTYTPNADYNGLDSLVYSVCDNGTPSLCDTAVVIFTITPVNDAPTAVTDSVTLNEDVPFTGNVLTNDSDPEGDALTASLVTAPVNGTVALNPDGSFTYTPNADYNGLDSLVYSVCDNGTPSLCDTAVVIFTITPVNDAPTAVTDSVTLNEDVPFTGNVLTNDSDPEGDALTASLVTAPVNGTVALNPDGSFTYTPNADYNGLDSLVYQVCDNGTPSLCDTAVVIFTITPVNDAPTAVTDSVTLNEDVPFTGNVLTNDSDPEGDALTASLVTAPVNGTVALNPDGSFTYTPNANFNGLDSLVYSVCDNGTPSLCDTAVVIFTITPVNDAPIAVTDSITLNEDVPFTGNVLTNDSDPEGDALTASLVTAPVNGTVALNPDGSFTYTPNADYNGLDSLVYQVCDNGTPSLCDTAVVIFTITPVNDAPTAVTDSVTLNEDVPFTGNVLTNDSDPEGDALTASLVTAPVNGTVALNPDGSFTYTPNANYNGLDSLVYSVCDNGTPSLCDTAVVIFTITPVNDAPIAVTDSITLNEDVPFTGNVLTNDSDPEGDALTASLVTAPVNGTVALNPDGSFTYTPNADYNGLDSLVYQVCDNGTPSLCDTAVVIFTITPVNDAPIAVTDSITLNEDVPFSGNVLTNDSDPEGDALTASLVTAPVNGTVALNPDGSFTYTPNADYNGLDSLVYQVCDNGTPSLCDTAVVIFTITPVNDAPIAVTDSITLNEDVPFTGNVLTNDSDPEGDALTASLVTAPVNGTVALNPDGSFTYTPNADYNGLDSLVYQVCDNGTPSLCDTAVVIFTITPVNDAPTAVTDSVTLNEDVPFTGNVLTNDSDPEGDALTASLVTAPVNGTVALNPDGSFTYTPNANFNGLDSLVYSVCDNGTPGLCDTAVVIFTITPLNDAPIAVTDSITLNEDVPFTGNVLTNDSDPEGDALTASLVTASVNGTVALNPDGSFTYTPNADYNGLDSLVYQVCDNGTPSLCDTAVVIFTITPVNDAPIAVTDSITLNEDVPFTGNVLTNDSDPEGDALTASLVTAPVNGTVALNPDGSFTYTPNADYNGLDSLVYQVCDNGTPSLCDTAVVIFTITPVNDAPIAVTDSITLNEDVPFSGNVLTNDSDPEGDALTASLVTAPVNGTVALNPDGSFTYTPNADYNGLDSLVYSVCDNGTPSLCDSAVVIFTITPVNDAPIAVTDSITLNEDVPFTGNVLTNDNDPEGDALTASLVTAPVNGTVALNPDGSFTYTPNANFNGLDSLVYSVCDNGTPSLCDSAVVIFTITPVNDAPIAVTDSITLNEDVPFTGNVLTNDSDSEGDALTASLVTAPVNGTVALNPDGSFTYTPNADYNGLDSLVYSVCDNGTPSLCDSAVVIFTITPVNDAPIAVTDSITLNEDVPFTGNVLTNDNDPEGDALTASLVTAPVNGTVALNPDGSFTYTPNADYNGSDSLVYSICDNGTPSLCDTAVVIFAITTVNDAPIAVTDSITLNEDVPFTGNVLTNDSDPEGDALTASLVTAPVNGTVALNPDGSFTYTPNADYNGLDSLVYQVCDNGTPSLCDTAVVIFTITPVNDAPIAVTDSITLNEDVPFTGNVLTNDSDPEGDALTASLVTAPVNGTVALNPDGSFTYTPNANFNGLDSLVYSVCDNGTPGLCDTAVVIITVTPVNNAPTGTGDTRTTPEDTPVNGAVTGADADGDLLTYTLGTAPVNGGAIVNADGTYTYTPSPDYNGVDSFTVVISDGNGGTVTVNVNITVTPVNDAPTGTGDTRTTTINTPVTGVVTGTDVDGDVLTYTLGTAPANGSAVVNTDGTYTYTPDPGFSGADSFTIVISDGNGGSVTVTVSITVIAVNNAPTGIGDARTTPEDTPVTGVVTGTDADGDALTYTLGTAPVNGGAIVNADGTYIYTPALNYNGADSFTILISDGKGGTATVTVYITVTPVNDAPTGTGDTRTTLVNTPVSGMVTGTDVDGDVLTYTLGTAPVNGTVVVNTDGTYTYTPGNNFTGADSFTIVISDGNGGAVIVTVNITVITIVQSPAVGLVKIGTINGNTITYIFNVTNTGNIPLHTIAVSDPKLGTTKHYTGVLLPGASVTLTAVYNITQQDRENGTVVNTATVTAITANNGTVTDVSGTMLNNDTPTETTVPGLPEANDDEAETQTSTPVIIPILDNDDPKQSTFSLGTLQIVTIPKHGQVTVNEDGTVRYVPDNNYAGEDDFSYRISDINGNTTNVAVVKITVKQSDIRIAPMFTPNGDGKNDVFEIRGLNKYVENELIIVNRWGNEVFRQRNYQNTWNGQGLNDGTYYYLLRVRKANSEGWEVLKGFTTIIRKIKD